MIHTSRQLKALVRNMSKGDSTKAHIIIRNYVMERFLERLSLSPYRNNLILKGGTLVSAMVGLDNRSTMDVDATIKNIPLSVESARRIVEEIAAVDIEDGMAFEIKSITTGTANTRMRDFYDIYALESTQTHNINSAVLQAAIANTCDKRGTAALVNNAELILGEIQSSHDMVDLWKNYQRKFEYAADIGWDDVIQSVRKLFNAAGLVS